jgi:hypothetical protein
MGTVFSAAQWPDPSVHLGKPCQDGTYKTYKTILHRQRRASIPELLLGTTPASAKIRHPVAPGLPMFAPVAPTANG